ncbi:DUF5995 family protein [Nocardia sp. BMG51109]|uniref:DUF5995 family protein n=1 Tax=Nocardia sp. BMG51109 TaxID=1056816 RepID=UPI0004639DF5|nr:DUF5995 family protein [Nocardia sp. BMG51109]
MVARSLVVGMVTAVLGVSGTSVAGAEMVAGVPAAVCGSPLSSDEISTVTELSDTTTLAAAGLPRLEEAVDRHHRITEILAEHRDRRGLFSIGLDVAELAAVMPLQRNPIAFASPGYAQAISFELLRRYLDNVHGEFTGGFVESHWAQYFSLAERCELSGARVAMVGYNAHITVDLAYATAAVGSRPDNAGDFFRIVDAIASSGSGIVDRTKAVYGADLGPLWRLYFVGEGLDQLAGQGVATGALLRAADAGYNVIVFGNGLALQDPGAKPVAEADIRALFDTANVAFDVLAQLRGL